MSRVLYRGTTELVDIVVKAVDDIDGTVAVSFDRSTWYPATWLDPVAPTRTAQITLSDTELPAAGRTHALYIKVSTPTESPVLKAGTVRVL